ncbi:MAG: T9SS type A sorting domain-containing protein [Bacteroidetes bacterium]|nr:T9SS type A sorting domain-containing protein [Bacteroidota bacterium]
MEKLFLFLAVFCTTNLFAQSGWQQISTPTNTSYTFNTIFFVSKDLGFLYYKQNYAPYFRDGRIYMTTDGGNTFALTSTNVILQYAYFKNANTGWILGDRINYEVPGHYYFTYQTTNGGASWTETEYVTNSNYTNCIKFSNDNTGWKTKNGGNGLFKTTNGGATWDSVAGNLGNTFVDYFTVNTIDSANSIYRLTTFYKGPGAIVKYSTNSGINWVQTGSPGSQIRNKNHFEFLNATCIVTYATGLPTKTTNYGVNWNSTLSIHAFMDISTLNNKYVWGLNTEGKIKFSTDGGSAFADQLNVGFTYDSSSHCFMFPADTVIHVTGFLNTGGRLYKTTTGGQVVTSVSNNESVVNNFNLSVYPNPFNPSTKLKVDTRSAINFLTINLYDLSGKLMKSTDYHDIHIGTTELNIDLNNLPTGSYLLKATGENFSETKKLVLLK